MGRKRVMMLGLDGGDPVVIQRLMDAGRLPNMKKALAQGIATKDLNMLGVFPSVTPPNWVSLATGNWPRTHGVTCFANHTLGKSLGIKENSWDSRRVESEFIWEALAKEEKRCIMLNYCQAWPPRVDTPYNIFIDGTGVTPLLRSNGDYQKIVDLTAGNFDIRYQPHDISESSEDCVVYGDQLENLGFSEKYQSLTKEMNGLSEVEKIWQDEPTLDSPIMIGDVKSAAYCSRKDMKESDYIISPLKEPANWQIKLEDSALESAILVNKGALKRYVVVTKNENGHYDTVRLYANRRTEAPLGGAKLGQWSNWIYDYYNIKDKRCKVAYKIRVLEMDEQGENCRLYISHALNLDDASYFYPKELAPEIYAQVGPMINFGKFDHLEPVSDGVLLETMAQMYQWHIDTTNYLFEKYADWQLYYTHLHAIDLYNHWYINHAIPGSDEQWAYYLELIYKIYEMHDHYVGAMMNHLDGDTTIFITSDHGAVPHSVGDSNPGFGVLSGTVVNVMEELGYLEVRRSNQGISIDWTKTRAIGLRSSYVYVNLKGRDPEGIVDPEDYDALVQEIISALYGYRHPNSGKRVFAFCLTREEMECIGMGGEHCGDIFVQVVPTFCDEHAYSACTVTNEGYSLRNLLIMTGSGLKNGTLLQRPVRSVDIVPTICHLLHSNMPTNVEGGVIYQALQEI